MWIEERAGQVKSGAGRGQKKGRGKLNQVQDVVRCGQVAQLSELLNTIFSATLLASLLCKQVEVNKTSQSLFL